MKWILIILGILVITYIAIIISSGFDFMLPFGLEFDFKGLEITF